MLPKNLWIRLAGCMGAMVVGFLAIKFMGVRESLITSDLFITLTVLMLVSYAVVHTFTEHFLISRK